MPRRTDAGAILAALDRAITPISGVFSTPQWGGRAYKVPGPGNSKSRPKLLAFVEQSKDGAAVVVSFKLPKPRAAAIVRQHAWIKRNTFGSLGRSGWVEALVSRAAQVKSLAPLIRESRSLLPSYEIESKPTPRPPALASSDAASALTDPLARHIASVLERAKADGWLPVDELSAPIAPRPRAVIGQGSR